MAVSPLIDEIGDDSLSYQLGVLSARCIRFFRFRRATTHINSYCLSERLFMSRESFSGLRRKNSEKVVLVAIQAITLVNRGKVNPIGKKGHFEVRAE